MTPRNRARLTLLFLVVLFAAPVLIAVGLHWSGWEPTQTRNHGELLRPPPELGTYSLRRADGSPYAWEPAARRWRIVVAPPPDCADTCVELIAGLDKVWQLQGRHADRLDVLWLGAVPNDAAPFRRFVPLQTQADFVAALPGNASQGAPTVYLLDPRGFLVMRYAPGFDLAGLREDVARLLKQS